MIDRVRWGILGTAHIALTRVIPAMQRSSWCEVTAIASRDLTKARAAANELQVPHAYGSYEELLADDSVEVVYNPLPNHLHVPWTLKAAAAGKHVLCEKPIALNAEEARTLIDARDRYGVRIQEAFMVRTHPQWLETQRLIRDGRIGTLRSIIEIPVCDQYEIQGTVFSQALRENKGQPIPLEDAINNMTVIEAVFKSASTGQWEEIDSFQSKR